MEEEQKTVEKSLLRIFIAKEIERVEKIGILVRRDSRESVFAMALEYSMTIQNLLFLFDIRRFVS